MLDQPEIDGLQQIVHIRHGGVVELGACGPSDRREDDACCLITESIPGLEVPLEAGFEVDFHQVFVQQAPSKGWEQGFLRSVGAHGDDMGTGAVEWLEQTTIAATRRE